MSAFAEQRLQQLDPLLLADREVLDLGVGVDAQPVPLAQLARCACGRSSRSSTGPRRSSSPSTMFSATVNTGMSWKCWCTMPIPRAMASAELRELHRLAVEHGSEPASGW